MKKRPAAPIDAKTITTLPPLDEAEAAELVRCERLLDGDADTPVEAGKVLRRIRDGQLHRATHGSFDDYCLDRWNMIRDDANRYIDASLAAQNVSPIGDKPTSEAQIHPLALFPPPDELQLLADETVALAQHEAVIERGIKTFYEVGASLLQIRDRRLYRITHDTFEAYCRERWSMSRPRAYQLIEAATIAGNLSTTVDIPRPVNESQLRPLAPLAPEDQRTVWAQAVEESDGQQPTALKVSEMVHERIERQREARIVEPPPAKRPDNNQPPMSRKKLKELREQERITRMRKSHVWDFMEAIEKLAKPAPPLDEVATEILAVNWEDVDLVGQSEDALRNLQILVNELHKVNLIPVSTFDAEAVACDAK